MRAKLLLFTVYLNVGLLSVSMRTPYERKSNFWTVWFLETE